MTAGGTLEPGDVIRQVTYFRQARMRPSESERCMEAATDHLTEVAQRLGKAEAEGLADAVLAFLDLEGWRTDVTHPWTGPLLREALSNAGLDGGPRTRHLRAVPGEPS